ncbi:uncharacterized protein LOC122646401 [Telopea speciosissima]|uniref:uncharacterized protein LOC122646401 n=1 Tax=Telopea speciosissima TaxID=54955 RepID=UPI001CC704A1|nr:uncharacterized protein LOC122646401 [Telopea speciosissima]
MTEAVEAMAKRVLPESNDPSPDLDITGVLREAIKLPYKNRKLMASVTLLVLFPYFILALLHSIIAGPLIEVVEDSEDDSRVQKDFKILIVVELAFFVIFCVVSLFGISVIICSSALTYLGKNVYLKELLRIIPVTWKRLLITALYVALFTVAYVFLILLFIGALGLITTTDAIIALCGLVGFPAALFYLYLAAVFMLGFVISVVEEDCYGIKALATARDLIRGSKIQGFGITVLLELLTGPISFLFILITFDDDLEFMAQMAFVSVATVVFCIARLFALVVYTVFYYGCKKSHGQEVHVELGSGYSLVPTKCLS